MTRPPLVIYDVEQRSPEWLRLRLGRATASEAAAIVATTRSGAEAAARRQYRVRLALERICQRPVEEGYTNADMQRGIALEGEALALYEARTGMLVRRTGFLAHRDLMAGASLDGDVDDLTGIVEVKCPRPATHLETLRRQTPGEYWPQLYHQLWLSGAAWADFVSYCPLFPDPIDLVIVRISREAVESDVARYVEALEQFLAEVAEEEARIRDLWAQAKAT